MKPLLSAKMDPTTVLQFPYYASPKIDGCRTLILNGVAVSRTLKPIPNKHIQSILGLKELNGLDGEIICGLPTDKDCFRNTTSVFMSHDKVAPFTFYVFDDFTNPDLQFHQRLDQASEKANGHDALHVIPHYIVPDQERLDAYESKMLEMGYEGVMLRAPNGRYKYGRSTAKEQILMKVKRYTDAEAIVVGFVELMHNDNEATVDNLGHTKRSTHQDGKRPADTLGALVVRDVLTNIEFEIGTGFTAEQRQHIWRSQGLHFGQVLTYKHFEHGAKDRPRHPVFLRWRGDAAA